MLDDEGIAFESRLWFRKIGFVGVDLQYKRENKRLVNPIIILLDAVLNWISPLWVQGHDTPSPACWWLSLWIEQLTPHRRSYQCNSRVLSSFPRRYTTPVQLEEQTGWKIIGVTHLLEAVRETRGRRATVIDEKLLKSIFLKRFKTKDIQDTNMRKRGVIYSLWLKRSSDAMDDPIEHHLPMVKRVLATINLVNRFRNGITSIDRLDRIQWNAIRWSSSWSSTRGHI